MHDNTVFEASLWLLREGHITLIPSDLSEVIRYISIRRLKQLIKGGYVDSLSPHFHLGFFFLLPPLGILIGRRTRRLQLLASAAGTLSCISSMKMRFELG